MTALLLEQPDSAIPLPRFEIKPLPGKQSLFLGTEADIAIYGGAAGGGKSYGLLLEPLHYSTDVPGYYSTIFRRATTHIRNPGGLWDQSRELYSHLPGAHPNSQPLEWTWETGGKIKFAHLGHDSTVFDWHGSQITMIGFDELTEFSSFQFWYLLSRNRSVCGVRPYVRATCNPDADSWVAEFISWWIDQGTGFPIPERAGKVRWFLRVNNDLKWADHPDDLSPELLGLPSHDPEGKALEYMPKSVTFIPADIYDNIALLDKDPNYLANLLAQPTVERERLLRGNWKIRPSQGLYFQRHWCEVVDEVPAGLDIRRGWDLAATPKTSQNDPDWTAGVKIGRSLDGEYYVLDHRRERGTPQFIERFIRNTASEDGAEVEQCIPQDPGQAGVAQKLYLARALSGFTVRFSTEARMQQNIAWQHHPKIARFKGFSSQAQAGNVKVLRGDWNRTWFAQLETFPEGQHDDDVDATSRAFNAFVTETTGIIDYYKDMARDMETERKRKLAPEPKTVAEGGVRVRGPESVNMVYDLKGAPIFRDAEGIFIVSAKHAEHLVKSTHFKRVDT